MICKVVTGMYCASYEFAKDVKPFASKLLFLYKVIMSNRARAQCFMHCN